MEFPQFSFWDRKVWHRCRQVVDIMIGAGGILFWLCQKCSHFTNHQPRLTVLGSSSSSSSFFPLYLLSPLPSSVLFSVLFSSPSWTFSSGNVTHIHSFKYHLYGMDPQVWSSFLNSLLCSNPDISYFKSMSPNKCHGISPLCVPLALCSPPSQAKMYLPLAALFSETGLTSFKTSEPVSVSTILLGSRRMNRNKIGKSLMIEVGMHTCRLIMPFSLLQ